MKNIPVNLDIRTATTTLFNCSHMDQDLVRMMISRLHERVYEPVRLYNLIINGITLSLSDDNLNSLVRLQTFILNLCTYSLDKKTQEYDPQKIAEYIAYHRENDYEPDYLLHKLNTQNVILHSFNMTTEPDALKDELNYVSINSYSGNFAVALG